MHVASRSAKVRGAIVIASVVEGLAVQLNDSGVARGLETDLPTAALADSGMLHPYIIAAAPDDFMRPVDKRQYQAGWRVVSDKTLSSGYSEPVETETFYKVGISNLYNPTIPSGFLVNLHRGGTYTVPEACFVDSADIKVVGTLIEVGDNGKWQRATVATNAVGEVVFYDATAAELTFELFD